MLIQKQYREIIKCFICNLTGCIQAQFALPDNLDGDPVIVYTKDFFHLPEDMLECSAEMELFGSHLALDLGTGKFS